MTTSLHLLAMHRAQRRQVVLGRMQASRRAFEAAESASESASAGLREALEARHALGRPGALAELSVWMSAIAVCDAWSSRQHEQARLRASELAEARNRWQQDRQAWTECERADARLSEWQAKLDRETKRRASRVEEDANEEHGAGALGTAHGLPRMGGAR